MKLFIFDLDETLFDKSGQLGESLDNLKNIKPFDDTHEVLQTLKGIKILVSKAMHGEDVVNDKVKILGIEKYFDEIIIVKSDEEKLVAFKNIIEKHKLNPKEVVVIGDRIDTEIRYGNILGCYTVLFRHGKYSNLKPKDDFEVPKHTILELRKLLELF